MINIYNYIIQIQYRSKSKMNLDLTKFNLLLNLNSILIPENQI